MKTEAVLRVFAGLGAAAFVGFAGLQFNDPDPVGWVAIYGCAAVACAFVAAGRGPWWVPAAVAVAAFLWALLLVPEVLGHLALADLTREMNTQMPEIEVGREIGGLLITTAWCGVTSWGRSRLPRSGRTERPAAGSL